MSEVLNWLIVQNMSSNQKIATILYLLYNGKMLKNET